MVTALSLMNRNPVTIAHAASVAEAAALMREHRIGSVFVERDGTLIGIVTEVDIVRRAVAVGHVPQALSVARIMSAPIIGIDSTRPITEAADLMERNHTRHLAVLKQGAIVGVLSVRDLLHPVSVDEL